MNTLCKRLVTAALVVAVSVAQSSAAAPQDGQSALTERVHALETAHAELTMKVQALSDKLKELESRLTPMQKRLLMPPLPIATVPLTDTPALGAPTAKVVVVEFTDFECPYCGMFSRQTWPELRKRFVVTGRVQWRIWDVPIPALHQHAVAAAQAAKCAGRQNRYWDMHEALFRDPRALDDSSIDGIARALGLDMPRFSDCARSAAIVDIQARAIAARELGITMTPTFFVGIRDGQSLRVVRVIAGAKGIAEFASEIDAVLAAASQTDRGVEKERQ